MLSRCIVAAACGGRARRGVDSSASTLRVHTRPRTALAGPTRSGTCGHPTSRSTAAGRMRPAGGSDHHALPNTTALRRPSSDRFDSVVASIAHGRRRRPDPGRVDAGGALVDTRQRRARTDPASSELHLGPACRGPPERRLHPRRPAPAAGGGEDRHPGRGVDRSIWSATRSSSRTQNRARTTSLTAGLKPTDGWRSTARAYSPVPLLPCPSASRTRSRRGHARGGGPDGDGQSVAARQASGNGRTRASARRGGEPDRLRDRRTGRSSRDLRTIVAGQEV